MIEGAASVLEVIHRLEAFAQRLYEDAAELSVMHQDRSAGTPWDIVANELERAAERIRYMLDKKGFKYLLD